MNFYSLVRLAEECRYPGDPVAAIVSDTTKPEGVFYRVADTYKLSQFYKPKVSLEEGIRRVAKHLSASVDLTGARRSVVNNTTKRGSR